MRHANSQGVIPYSFRRVDEDDTALREAVPLAEPEKLRASYDLAKDPAGSSRGLLIL